MTFQTLVTLVTIYLLLASTFTIIITSVINCSILRTIAFCNYSLIIEMLSKKLMQVYQDSLDVGSILVCKPYSGHLQRYLCMSKFHQHCKSIQLSPQNHIHKLEHVVRTTCVGEVKNTSTFALGKRIELILTSITFLSNNVWFAIAFTIIVTKFSQRSLFITFAS